MSARGNRSRRTNEIGQRCGRTARRTGLRRPTAAILLLIGLVAPAARSAAQSYTFTHMAGARGGAGTTDGAGSAARFREPRGIASDASGTLYVADTANHIIRKVTSSGNVSTLAGLAGTSGSTDGTGSAARFSRPSGIAVDTVGNVFVADTDNSTIRKITPAGQVTTFAGSAGTVGSTDGTGIVARFSGPTDIAIDSSGTLFVADTQNSTIRKVTSAGVVDTLAGLPGVTGAADGTGGGARFNKPEGVAVTSSGTIYVSDTQNHTIRAMTSLGAVTTLAGTAGAFGTTDGTGSLARFRFPAGATVDAAGVLYVADRLNYSVRMITAAGVVTRLAGSPGIPGSEDGTGSAAEFSSPSDAAVHLGTGTVFVADTYNHVVRAVTSAGVVTTFAGAPAAEGHVDGTGGEARFYDPSGVAVDASGNVYVADSVNHVVRMVTPTGVASTLAGLAGSQGSTDGTGSAARFGYLDGIAIGPAGNILVADTSNHTIRKVTPAGVVTTLAGLAGVSGTTDGTGNAARFNDPRGIAVDATGDIYVADSGNHTIRKVTSAGVVTTHAGQAGTTGTTDGLGGAARFNSPYGVAARPNGALYVADRNNHTIRKVTPAGDVSTLAGLAGVTGWEDGTGVNARFRSPKGVAVDTAGTIYIADTSNATIRTSTAAGDVATIGGQAFWYGAVDGAGTEAQFNLPFAITVDGSGAVYIGDEGNNAIRKGTNGAAATSQLIVVKSGTGSGTVTSPAAGILCGVDCLEAYPTGTVVTLDAVATAGSVFSGWGGGGCSGTAECVTTMQAATTVAATFSLPPVTAVLVVAKSGTGSGTVTSGLPGIACGVDCSESYPVGSVVGLSAVASAGSVFAGWSGGGCSGTGACAVTMATATTVNATFTMESPPPPATLTVSPTGTGSGTVTSTPAGIDCPDACMQAFPVGVAVTLAAVANAGSIFEGWSGGGCSSTGPCTVMLNTSTSVTATFIADAPTAETHTVYLAEGATSAFLDTRIAIFNGDSTDTVATLTFQPTGRTPIVVDVTVPARRRVTFDPKTVPGLESAEFATKIESSTRVVVDRTMSWDVSGYGAHAETAVDAPALTWYLAEGATHSGFNLFYLLQNPNALDARVRVRFLTPSGAPLEKTYTLPPTSRTNIWVNVEDFPGLGMALASTDVSASFECLDDRPIIVERALYLDRPGQVFAAGHESAGVTAPATEWFLAEGATGDYFDLYVLVANTTNTDAAIEASFLLPDGTVVVKPYTVKANSRFNVWVDAQDPRLADTAVSTTMRSTNGVPIIVERALWWPGTFEQWYEAHNSPGATKTGVLWAMAEGEVGGTRDVDTFILIANTSPTAGSVEVTLLFDDGTSAFRTFTVSPNSRFNVDVRTEFPAAVGKRFGAIVESVGDVPARIVVERAMYWDAGGQSWAAGTNALARLVRENPAPQ